MLILSNLIIAALFTLGGAPRAEAQAVLSETQFLRIQQVSSVFENSDIAFQYDYVEDIEDGAGVTAGRVGFNNASLKSLIIRYTEHRPDNKLSKYLPCLNKIIETHSDYACLFPSMSAKQLKSKRFKKHRIQKVDFGKDFIEVANDPLMIQSQDELVKEGIVGSTVPWLKKLNIQSTVGYLIIFDSILQQGFGVNGLQVMVSLAPPREGMDELTWLRAFLKVRRDVQMHPFHDDGVTRYEVAPYECYERSDSLLEILDSGNIDLQKPLEFHYFKDKFITS